jgi:cytochrome c oxidase subunit 2
MSKLCRLLVVGAGLLVNAVANAAWQMNLPRGVTQLSHDAYDLHMMALWICVAIGIITFGPLIYALIAFRKSKGAKPATWDHSSAAEFIWTVIPILILIAMAVPAARALVRIEDTRGAQLNIKITAYQWKWHYEYGGSGVSFFSGLAQTSNVARQLGSETDPFTVDHYLLEVDKPLVIPTRTKIRYLLTSNDVNHAWWVQPFSVKRDAIPGYINEGWFQVDEPGVYRGQCAELCGKDHGFMPIVVKAVPPTEFKAWLDSQKPAAPPSPTASN